MVNSLITFGGISLELLLKENNDNSEKVLNKLLNCEEPDNYKEAGSDINSIVSIIKQGLVNERINLFLFVSDSEKGRKCGEIIKEYFQKSDYSFENVELVKIEHLDPKNQYDFKFKGLRNVISKIADIYNQYQSSLAINATSGFKSVVSFAQIFACIMKIPVFYKFFEFERAIELGRIPIKLNLNLWIENKSLFDIFSYDNNIEFFSEKQISEELGETFIYNNLSNEMKNFFDTEIIDKQKYLALNPFGVLFLNICETELNTIKKNIKLRPTDKKVGSKISVKNREANCEEMMGKHVSFFNKLEKLEFVEKIKIIDYSKICDRKNYRVKIYGDKLKAVYGNTGGQVRFLIWTTAKTEEENFLAIDKILELG